MLYKEDYSVRDWFFCKGWLNFNKDAVATVLCWPAGLKTSFLYELITLCSKQSLKGSELIFSNYFDYVINFLHEPNHSSSESIVCICFGLFVILSLIFCLSLVTMMSMHSQNGAAFKCFKVVCEEVDMKTCFFYIEI